MPMHPAHRLIQLGLRSLGFDPGAVDGWWGPNTRAAAAALAASGPAKESPWAVRTLQRGFADLGWNPGVIDGQYGPNTRVALRRVIDADGASRAAAVVSERVLEPVKPELVTGVHQNFLRQGSGGTIITGLMQHCGALPGSWHRGKTNRQMVEAIHRMHTLPPSQGGRGWSDTGYHEIICPDGERFDARPIGVYGAGAVGYNRGWKHVLMIEVETITETRHPEDHFTPETLASMRDCIEEFAGQTQFKRLAGHREVASKLCPGHEVIDRDWTDLAVS